MYATFLTQQQFSFFVVDAVGSWCTVASASSASLLLEFLVNERKCDSYESSKIEMKTINMLNVLYYFE